MRVLVTGGVRCGKSSYAEGVLRDEPSVTYVAPGPRPDDTDPEWCARVAAHRARRPAHWVTVETTDVARAVRATVGAVLVDCLGTWLSALLDEVGWGAERAHLEHTAVTQADALGQAVADSDATVVLVTNEVGWGVVPEHPSGRVFRDLLGLVNQRVATACDDVVLMVAGRPLTL